MELTRQVVVLDAADVGDVSAFWAELLGGGVVDGINQIRSRPPTAQ